MLQLQFLNVSKPPIWLVETNYKIGSAANANCILNLPGVMPLHASLLIEDERIELLPHAANTAVNGQMISGPTQIYHGDTLEIGGILIGLVDPKLTTRLAPKARPAPTLVESSIWQLQPVSTALDPNILHLNGRMIIGRAKECDIRLNFSHLSRRHASLSVTPEGLELEDLGSSNGTYVNEIKVRRMLLKNGDTLSFDSLKFRILGPEEDSDKTVVLPTADELYPTHLLHGIQPPAEPLRPAAAPARPPPMSSSYRPSTALPDSIHRARVLLLIGIAIVAVLFGSLIFFLLH